MSIFNDYYNLDLNQSFNKDQLPKLYPILFLQHIKELALKIDTYDSGMLCATSIEAYGNAHFIQLYELCRLGTFAQYATAKEDLAAWNELSLRILGRTYTIEDMQEIGKKKIAELGYRKLSE